MNNFLALLLFEINVLNILNTVEFLFRKRYFQKNEENYIKIRLYSDKLTNLLKTKNVIFTVFIYSIFFYL